jgi:hypothetical protein
MMWLAYAYQAGNLGKVDVPQAVRWFVEGQLSVDGSRVHVASGAAQLFTA